MLKNIFRFKFLTALFAMMIFAGAAMSVNAQSGTDGTVPSANIFGLTSGNQLIRFSSNNPGTITTIGAITGLQGGENLLGIDFRPATGQLYALGNSSRIYTINTTTAAATSVGVLTTALSGTNFGFDFNPTVDRIRIVSNTGQNLRVNPDTASAIVDGAINGAATAPTGAAYTNNFSGATTTALYDIDATTDMLYQQNPANSGTLVLVGPLGVDFQAVNGFDFFSGNNTAFAASASGLGNPQLYTINLTTGAATAVGSIGGITNLTPLTGLAVQTGATATPGFNILALTTSNQLIRFNGNRSNTPFGSPIAITGLQSGENILGIDFRPVNGQLYGLGSTSRLYRINPTTGAAMQVGTAGAFTLNGTDFGFDFNPTVDLIRVVSNTGQNLRLNPNDGTLSATDPNLNGAATGADGAGYTNSAGNATTTMLFDIYSVTDTLYQQNPANAGTLVTVGPLGLDITGVNGFDISNVNNTALAALQTNGSSTSGLYRINLTTGAATFVSPINSATAIRGLAIGSGSAASRVLDFDGDGITCYTVFRPSNSTWYIRSSVDGSSKAVTFGTTATDVFTPGDYDGDGKTDISVWRTTTGIFFSLRSSDNAFVAFPFGTLGDEPVARDYDGDGITDYAVVRRTNGQMIWYYRSSITGNTVGQQFGADTDIVAPGDYDGDGRFDLAVRRGTGSQQAFFFIQQSTAGFTAIPWGFGSDFVSPGDYDGDGRTDVTAVRQGTNYTWFIRRSSDGGFFAVPWGAKPMFTAQGDYDGDGRTDVTVWDPSSGIFYVKPINASFFQFTFGQNGDYPVANYDTH